MTRKTFVHSAPFALCALLFVFGTPGIRAQDPMFIVLMTESDPEDSMSVLHDMYCFDPVLPARQADCNYRVLAPVDGYFSDSRIGSMSVDFEHPSKGTNCRMEWLEYPFDSDVTVSCDEGRNRFDELPAFRAVNSTSDWIRAIHIIRSEANCLSKVYSKRYYKFGLNNFPEQRPTVVIRSTMTECRGGAIFGRPDYYITTEAPCVYNKRRRCRPLNERQKEERKAQEERRNNEGA